MTKPSNDGRLDWLRAYARGLLNGNLFKELSQFAYNNEQIQDPHSKSRLNAADGPMLWLGDQICKRMERSGWPSMIRFGYRTPEHQNRLYNSRTPKGRRITNARAYQSPHNFYEAVDIVHKTKGWQASPAYWEALAQCVRVVSKEYGVPLTHGHHWKMVDSAHIELSDWREVRKRQLRFGRGNYRPTTTELAERFEEVLPLVWRAKHGTTDPYKLSASKDKQLSAFSAWNKHKRN